MGWYAMSFWLWGDENTPAVLDILDNFRLQ